MNYETIFQDAADRIFAQVRNGDVKPWRYRWSEPKINDVVSQLWSGKTRLRSLDDAKSRIEPIHTAEAVLRASGANIVIDSLADTPSYCGYQWDRVVLVDRDRYQTAASYYASAFHELGHWTARRVGRPFQKSLNTTVYEEAREEMTAEFTSAFICAVLGIGADLIESHAAYIVGWFGDGECGSRDVAYAIAEAKKAAAYLLKKAEQPLQMAA